MRTLSVAPALYVTALLLSCDAWSHVGVPPDIKHPSIETPGAHTQIAKALSDNTGSAAISKEECIRFFSKRAKDDARLICSNFRFSFVQDAKSWEELDHVVVETGDKSGPLDACLVAKLIRDTEALLRTRFLELRFEKLQIEGTLHLKGVDTIARLVFADVIFLQPSNRECGSKKLFNPAFQGASVIFDDSRFRERVVFRQSVFEGADFTGNLLLGHKSKLRGQLIVHDVGVAGSLNLEGLEFIDTDLSPIQIAPGVSDRAWARVSESTKDCVCNEHDGSLRVDINQVENGETRIDERKLKKACRALTNLPRCPRSNGSKPSLIEISRTEVAGSFSVANLVFDPPTRNPESSKTNDQRHESTMSRLGLGSSEFVVDDLTVGGTALFLENRGGAIYVLRSEIQGLRSENNRFGSLVVTRNSVGSFKSVRDTFLHRLTVVSNDVKRSLEFDSSTFAAVKDAKVTGDTSIQLTHNFVGRDLTFTPYELKTDQVKEIDLSNNRVVGGLSVNFPVETDATYLPSDKSVPGRLAWSGKVILNSLTIDGSLALNLAERAPATKRAIVDFDAKRLSRHRLNCGAQEIAKSSIYLDFANTQTNDFVWALPLERSQDLNREQDSKNGGYGSPCVTWEGVGLRYANWKKISNPEDDRATTNDNPLSDDFGKWGLLYNSASASGVPPDPLHFMADHLFTLGAQRDSLQKRAEAKQADYPLLWGECGVDLWGHDSDSFIPGSCKQTIGNLFARFIFLPTDFGTKPHRALIILIGVIGSAALVYAFCKRQWRDAWPYFEQVRDTLRKREHMLDSLLQHLAQADLERAASDRSARGGLPDDRTIDLEFVRNAARLGDKGDVGKLLDRYAKIPENDKFTCENTHVLELPSGKPLFPFGEVMNISGVPGFMQYDRNRQPQEFSIYRYAVDVTIPVVDLHAYSQYFPASGWVRALSVLQHLTGWWVLTSFLASLAVI